MRHSTLVASFAAFVAVAIAAATPIAAGAAIDSPADSAGPTVDGAAAGHGNHVVVDAQVSADGTVVAETVATLAAGFLVIRTDDGGRPGEPVGHTYLNGTVFRTDVAVSLDEDTWADWSGNRTLWAVVHFDDGDGEFDLGSDPSAVTRSPAASRAFALGRGDAPVRVLARQADPLALEDGSVTVRHVTLASPGYVVAHSIDGERAVGTRALPAGAHENVSLALDESFVAGQESRFRVRLVAYRDDGDGEFDADDRPVRVGDERVGTDVVVRRADDDATTTRPLVITPTPTAGSTSGTPASATDASAAGRRDGTAADADRGTDTGAFGPGFGHFLGLVVLPLGAKLVSGGVPDWLLDWR